MKISDEAVEAGARADYGQGDQHGTWETEPEGLRELYLEDVRRILEAAAPHMFAGVTALADAWEARGEHDMKVAKTIEDDYISSEVLGQGAQMVENARHIRNALRPTP